MMRLAALVFLLAAMGCGPSDRGEGGHGGGGGLYGGSGEPAATPGIEEVVRADGVRLEVLNWARSPDLGSREAPEGREFVHVRLRAANEGERPWSFLGGQFGLIVEGSDRPRAPEVLSREPGLGETGQIAAGMEVEGWLTFAVPEGARPGHLSYRTDLVEGEVYRLALPER